MTSKIFFMLLAGSLAGCKGDNKKSIDYLGQQPPGESAQLFAPGLISTPAIEHSAPAFSPDGQVVLWTVVDSTYRAHLFEMKYENGAWTPPAPPAFADTTADDYYPSFSPDGKKLFFSSRRKVPPGYTQGRGIRIWEVERTEVGWGIPMPFDTAVSKGQDYAHSITQNGTLYFSSDLGGGTSWNFRRAEKQENGYLTPVLLPYSINSVDYEDGPFIAPDESFLIFESQRPEGINGSIDLYISFRSAGGVWSVPVNMGPKVNSTGTERFARLSPDGKFLFFGSTRDSSPARKGFDIYWIDAAVIDELRTPETQGRQIQPLLGGEILDALYREEDERSSLLLKRWINEYPNSLDATVVYSSILRRQGNLAEAQRLLNATPKWSENTSIIMEKVLVNFGLGQDAEAVKILTPLLQDESQLRERYIYISRALLDMRKYTLSDDYFEKAMAIFPSSFPYYHRGCAYAQAGEKERAFAALHKAVDYGGYNLRKDYEADSRLDNLKLDSRWKKLVARLR
jgi:WD40-like Beta Propeller Repeat